MRRSYVLLVLPLLYACNPLSQNDAGTDFDAGEVIDADEVIDAGEIFDAGEVFDAGIVDAGVACLIATEVAVTQQHPVDIIWMIDNSSSMTAAITEVTNGLEAFTTQIENAQLDYKIIMLSLRGETSPVTINGSMRYPICVLPPLAGAHCANAPRFFHSSINVNSTQPLEQFLGTLGQTSGYLATDTRGGEAWLAELRPLATKTIVMVTDDNARFSANDFEHFAGGQNPFSGNQLPPGLLDPSWSGLFDGYRFNAIYGWGSDTDPAIRCQYPDMTNPASSGQTYTQLVSTTGGVRAKICDGANAWGPFFDALVQSVESSSRLDCEIAIPTPGQGTLDPTLVNVMIESADGGIALNKISDAGCGPGGGWHYDNDAAPTQIELCPTSCDAAQAEIGPGRDGGIKVLFGCASMIE
jgi:hypothetical protein